MAGTQHIISPPSAAAHLAVCRTRNIASSSRCMSISTPTPQARATSAYHRIRRSRASLLSPNGFAPVITKVSLESLASAGAPNASCCSITSRLISLPTRMYGSAGPIGLPALFGETICSPSNPRLAGSAADGSLGKVSSPRPPTRSELNQSGARWPGKRLAGHSGFGRLLRKQNLTNVFTIRKRFADVRIRLVRGYRNTQPKFRFGFDIFNDLVSK